MAAATAVPGLTSAAPGRQEDPGFFGDVTETVDVSSFKIRLHETGEELLIQAQPAAEVGRDGSAKMTDFEPGERVTALGARVGDTVSATAVFSVADVYDDVVVTGRKGARIDTTAGPMTLDAETIPAQIVGDRPNARPVPPDSIQPGSKLWVLARRDPVSKSAVVWRFAKYSG